MVSFQGVLYTVIGALPPAVTVLSSNVPLTTRSIVCLCLVCIVAGAVSLKAYLSTTFAESRPPDPPIQPPASSISADILV